MHDGGMKPARRPRGARGYPDTALTRALFKAQARRRSARPKPPPAATRHWPVVAASWVQPDTWKVLSSDNIRTTPYQVIVAGDNFTPGGTIIPGLQDVSVSPSTTSADSLSWQEDRSLQASWSWTVISDVDRAGQISNICLVLVGVVSSALIAILGYLIKLLITSNRSARTLVLRPTAKLRPRL
jgi:hypothetical protein